MRHTEPLLLVHDQQTQVLKYEILRKEAMGPDNDIHRPLADPFNRFVLLFPAAEPAQRLNINRIPRKPFPERFIMLLRQNRRRHQHGHLFALDGRLERGPDRDFRFSVAYVAAQQPIHRPG
ncbi:hypothetical protein D1872_238400 [compost metagenome]